MVARHAAAYFGSVRSELRQVVAAQDVQRLQQHNPARAWRRRGQHFQPVILPDQRRALLHLIRGEVLGRDEPVVRRLKRRDLLRHLALVEVLRIGRDPLQRRRQLRLLEQLARLVEPAVALEDPLSASRLL
jgi:hypothetical protein